MRRFHVLHRRCAAAFIHRPRGRRHQPDVEGQRPNSRRPRNRYGPRFPRLRRRNRPEQDPAARAASPSVPIAVYVKAGGVCARQTPSGPTRKRCCGASRTASRTHRARTAGLRRDSAVPESAGGCRRHPTPGKPCQGPDCVVDWILVETCSIKMRRYSCRSGYNGLRRALCINDATRRFATNLARRSWRALVANGWQGGAPQAAAGAARRYRGLPMEFGPRCWYAKCSGKAPTPDRFCARSGGAAFPSARACGTS